MPQMNFVEEDGNESEIDDISYFGFVSEKKETDPFLEIKINSLSPKMKRRANRLQKKYEGEDGTASKYIDPLVVNGHSLS